MVCGFGRVDDRNPLDDAGRDELSETGLEKSAIKPGGIAETLKAKRLAAQLIYQNGMVHTIAMSMLVELCILFWEALSSFRILARTRGRLDRCRVSMGSNDIVDRRSTSASTL